MISNVRRSSAVMMRSNNKRVASLALVLIVIVVGLQRRGSASASPCVLGDVFQPIFLPSSVGSGFVQHVQV
jgi:hypothetical protein